MKKKIKIAIGVFLALTLIPLLFFSRGSAEEMDNDEVVTDDNYYPVATPDIADMNDLATKDFEVTDFFSFNYFAEIADGSSDLGQLGQVLFNMKFEIQYVNAFLQANQDGSIRNLTTEQYLACSRLYELCWLHLILQFAVSIYIGAGMYKFIKGNI